MRKSIRILLLVTLGLGFIKAYSHPWHLPVKAKLGHSDLPLDLKVVVSKMISTTNYTGDDINIVLDKEDTFRAEAFAGANVIYIGQGWLDLSFEAFHDYRLIYFIIAHELTHITKKHMRHAESTEQSIADRNEERESDYTAVKILYDSYLDCKLAAGTLDIIDQMGGINSTFPTSHPNTLERVENTLRACTYLQEHGKMPNDLYFEQSFNFDYSFITDTYNNAIFSIREFISRSFNHDNHVL